MCALQDWQNSHIYITIPYCPSESDPGPGTGYCTADQETDDGSRVNIRKARLRFSAQKPGEFYAARGDYLVDTGGSTPLEEAVAPILAELTAPPEENSL